MSKIMYLEFGLRKYYIKFRPYIYYSKIKDKTQLFRKKYYPDH